MTTARKSPRDHRRPVIGTQKIRESPIPARHSGPSSQAIARCTTDHFQAKLVRWAIGRAPVPPASIQSPKLLRRKEPTGSARGKSNAGTGSSIAGFGTVLEIVGCAPAAHSWRSVACCSANAREQMADDPCAPRGLEIIHGASRFAAIGDQIFAVFYRARVGPKQRESQPAAAKTQSATFMDQRQRRRSPRP